MLPYRVGLGPTSYRDCIAKQGVKGDVPYDHPLCILICTPVEGRDLTSRVLPFGEASAQQVLLATDVDCEIRSQDLENPPPKMLYSGIVPRDRTLVGLLSFR